MGFTEPLKKSSTFLSIRLVSNGHKCICLSYTLWLRTGGVWRRVREWRDEEGVGEGERERVRGVRGMGREEEGESEVGEGEREG